MYVILYSNHLEGSVLENAVYEIFKTVCRVADNKRMLLNDFWAAARGHEGGGTIILYRTDGQTRQQHLRPLISGDK